MLESLFNKAASLKVCNFLKNRLKHRCSLWILQNCLRIAFLCNTSSGCFCQLYHGGDLFFNFAPSRALDFDQKFSRNATQIILYYYVTKQFLAYLSWMVTCIWFQNMFSKTLIAFNFDEILTQSAGQATVISRVRILSSPALGDWSGAFNFREWMPKNAV